MRFLAAVRPAAVVTEAGAVTMAGAAATLAARSSSESQSRDARLPRAFKPTKMAASTASGIAKIIA